MWQTQIGILCLKETHINTSSKEIIDSYVLVYSSRITDQDRENKDKNKHSGEGQHKGKGKGKHTTEDLDRTIGHEFHGVAIAYSPRAFAANNDFEQISSRRMYTTQETTHRHLCIIDGYAPQSNKPTEEKEKFYEELEHLINKFKSTHIIIIMGDFNSRLHYRLEHEKASIAPHVFGRGEEFAQQQSQTIIESRDLFTQLCLGNDLIVTNTFHKQTNNNYCTHREMSTDGFKAPWTPERFSMIDFC